jgi:hypothetical protein
MSDYFKSLDRIDISLREYCFLMENTDKYADTFKVYMPTLMPLFNMTDKIKIQKETYSKDIFINDPACKLSDISIVEVQNYITVRRKRNSWFKLHPNTFDKGTRLLCEIPEKNIRHIRILDDEYNVDMVDTPSDVFVRNPSFEILDKIGAGDSVKVSFWTYSVIPIGSTPGTGSIEYDEEGVDSDLFEYIAEVHYFDVPPLASIDPMSPALPAEFSSDDVESVTVTSERKFCRTKQLTSGTGTVISVHDWGLKVTVGGKVRHITPSNIIGFSKKAGEYYSYYEDSFNGGT